eukprot:12185-Heterococcus_DN1.PRE.4
MGLLITSPVSSAQFTGSVYKLKFTHTLIAPTIEPLPAHSCASVKCVTASRHYCVTLVCSLTVAFTPNEYIRGYVHHDMCEYALHDKSYNGVYYERIVHNGLVGHYASTYLYRRMKALTFVQHIRLMHRAFCAHTIVL